MSEADTLIVPSQAAGDRLDAFLQSYGGDAGPNDRGQGAAATRSRSEWQRLITLGAVRLNGAAVKSSYRVAEGDRVTVADSPRRLDLPRGVGEHVPFAVVYEDPTMIVVDKPAGVVVHPAPGNESGTLVHGLLARYPELRGGDHDDQRPGIVHRLDKDTSGLMVVGRTLAAVNDLQTQMQQRTTEKRYLLLVRGNIGEDEALIDRPIARDPNHRQRLAVRPEGKASQTHFWVRERFGEWTLVEALLLTGRTHQLRVHFASIGHPLAGDTTYGPTRRPLAGLDRQFLHSSLLRVRSPHDRAEHTFRSELPAELAESLDRLRRSAKV